MIQITHKTRWIPAGFGFLVRLIGVKFAPPKTLKNRLKGQIYS